MKHLHSKISLFSDKKQLLNKLFLSLPYLEGENYNVADYFVICNKNFQL